MYLLVTIIIIKNNYGKVGVRISKQYWYICVCYVLNFIMISPLFSAFCSSIAFKSYTQLTL